MKKVSLIGSTGSIGRQAIEVCLRHPDKFRIIALCAGRRGGLFERQVKALSPKFYGTADSGDCTPLAALEEADIILNAASGFAGLAYSFAAVAAGKTLALANKETLVCGGEIITALAKETGARIIPVDSEHSAIWQCLGFGERKAEKLIITASGGPFRDADESELERVTPELALKHPTWNMGKKVTVDSATLMNKAYEVMEAHFLYGTPYGDITAVIHPQSIVHSMVQFADGAILAQMNKPDMKLPIQLALSYPERLDCGLEKLDFGKAFTLEFLPLDVRRYPCFALGMQAAYEGGIAPCVLNAADETAVSAFLGGRIPFTRICGVVEYTLRKTPREELADMASLVRADAAARRIAAEYMDG